MGDNKLERNILLAELLKPLMVRVDLILGEFSLDELHRISQDMWEPVGTLQALPFPATLNKSEQMKMQCYVFDAVVKLVEERSKQKEAALRGPSFCDGSEILKSMGLS